MKYKCICLKSGNVIISDMLQNCEFNRRFGHMAPHSLQGCALLLINEWNKSVNNRDAIYIYTLLD